MSKDPEKSLTGTTENDNNMMIHDTAKTVVNDL